MNNQLKLNDNILFNDYEENPMNTTANAFYKEINIAAKLQGTNKNLRYVCDWDLYWLFSRYYWYFVTVANRVLNIYLNKKKNNLLTKNDADNIDFIIDYYSSIIGEYNPIYEKVTKFMKGAPDYWTRPDDITVEKIYHFINRDWAPENKRGTVANGKQLHVWLHEFAPNSNADKACNYPITFAKKIRPIPIKKD